MSTAAHLRALDRDGLDPWDAPAEPASQPPLDAEEAERAARTIREHQYDDRALIPDGHWAAFDALCALGIQGNRDASQAVRRMVLRAVSGVPLGEPDGAL